LRRIGSSARVVTVREANGVPSVPANGPDPTDPEAGAPAAGLRPIDPGAFVLRYESLAPPPGAGLDAVTLDRELRRFGRGGGAPLAARLASRLTGGWRWDDEDCRTKAWYPQGIDGRGDRLLVSWYSTVDNRARLSVLDTAAGRYGHVALVTPDGKPVTSHAGGLAWREDLLYVADTTRGLRVFDLTRFAGDTLPQAGWYRPQPKGLRFSYVSVDEAAGGLLVGEYRDKLPGARLVRWPFAAGGLLAQEPAEGAWVTAHSNLQGAVAIGGRVLLASSNGQTLPGRLTASPFAERADHHRWATGGEDLAAVGGEVVSVTEHPDLRWPLPRRRAVFRARPPAV
jgi:hypothetical protein